MNEGPSLLSSTQLKERGCTPAVVKKFLSAPDATKPNPYYRSAAPMQLYSLVRVEVCEQEEGWKQANARATERSKGGKTLAARTVALLIVMRCQSTIPTIRRSTPSAGGVMDAGIGLKNDTRFIQM